MWPDWAFYGMAMLAACLFGVLCYPLCHEVNCKVANWWIARRAHRDHAAWMARRAERMREGVR